MLVLVLLSIAVATMALVSQQLTVTRANNSGPDEGFYWTVAQYQIAHHRLKQEVRAIAAGEAANTEELGHAVGGLGEAWYAVQDYSFFDTHACRVPGCRGEGKRAFEKPILHSRLSASRHLSRIRYYFIIIDDAG